MSNPSYASITFTPRAAGKLALFVDFDGIVSTGNDWSLTGNYVTATPFILQSASYSYGTAQRMGTAKAKFAVQHTSLVAANASVECGIKIEAFGLSTGVVEFVNVRAQLLKETST